MNKSRFDWAKWLPILIIAIVLMIIYKTFDNFTQISTAVGRFFRVISPLLYGILFTYFLYTPHRLLEKLLRKVKIKKFTFISNRATGIATIIMLLLLLGVISLIIIFALPAIFSSVVDLTSNIPGYLNAIVAYFNNLPSDNILAGLNIAGLLTDNAGTIVNAILNASWIEQAARGVISFAGGLFNVLLGLAISLYLLLERRNIANFFTRFSNTVIKNERKRERTKKYLSQINSVLFTFIASKGFDSIINFVAVTTLLLIFRVPYALLLGLIAGLFNFIPYIGSIIACVLISLLTLLTRDLTAAIPLMACLLAFQQLDGNYIEPRIMKSSFKISPILVIVAVSVGGAYFGIPGMFFAVPIVVIVNQILDEYMSSVETEKALHDSEEQT